MPEASLSNPQPSPTQPTSQGINWKNIIIGAVIGAVLFGGGGFLVYNAYQPKKEEPAQTTTTPKTATPSTTPKEKEEPKDETADWKTYTNNKLKFSLKYPANYGINEFDNGTRVEFLSPDFQAKASGVAPQTSSGTLKGAGHWIKINPTVCTEKIESYCYISRLEKNKTNLTEYKVNGVTGQKFNYIDTHGEKEIVVIVKRENIIYDMQVGVYPDYILTSDIIEIFDQMLSTFKFL